MTTGTSFPVYPEQPPPPFSLKLDDSYFLVRLHAAQAFFSGGRFNAPDHLLMSSSVENSFHSNSSTVQSLHQITPLTRDIPCQLGVSINLTDWLPARTTDWLHIKFAYTVVRNSPIKDLMDKIGESGLTARLSTISTEVAVAVKVSEIVGRLLSSLAGEGSKQKLFTLEIDLNLATLKTGYYVILGSQQSQNWPEGLSIDTDRQLKDNHNRSLVRYSYVVLEVLGIKRRGSEMMRGQPWWELLQTVKETVMSIEFSNSHARHAILNYWCHLLDRVRQQAREEHECLLKEIDDIIREAHMEVMAKLHPTSSESFGDNELPLIWQKILTVRTESELQESVQVYRDALRQSQFLLNRYHLTGG